MNKVFQAPGIWIQYQKKPADGPKGIFICWKGETPMRGESRIVNNAEEVLAFCVGLNAKGLTDWLADKRPIADVEPTPDVPHSGEPDNVG